MVELPFQDRVEAGRLLAAELATYAQRSDVIVLGLPRGGIAVAFEVAKALRAPLDVMIVRKLGVPGQEELALGAVASGGVRVINQSIVDELATPAEIIEAVARVQQSEMERRELLYRGERGIRRVSGLVTILVDDGIATGSTMRAAVQALRVLEPARIVVAIPVAPASSCMEFRGVVDELVCLAQPEGFFAVGQWYSDFSQTSDEEVQDLLRQAAEWAPKVTEETRVMDQKRAS